VKVNGLIYDGTNPIDAPSYKPITIVYKVTNNGKTALANPRFVDEKNPSSNNDDVTFPKPLRGDDPNKGVLGVLDIGETWEYSGVPDGPGEHILHPVFRGDPIDAQGAHIGNELERSKTAVYFVSEPHLLLSAGIVEGHNGVASCDQATSPLAVPPSTLITYCYKVKNTGNVDLLNVKIIDELNRTVTVPVLAPGMSATRIFEDTNTLGFTESRLTEVNASGTAPNGDVVPANKVTIELGRRQLPAT
jgi:uncharacterized repeat protein (TIGR01451 family)